MSIDTAEGARIIFSAAAEIANEHTDFDLREVFREWERLTRSGETPWNHVGGHATFILALDYTNGHRIQKCRH